MEIPPSWNSPSFQRQHVPAALKLRAFSLGHTLPGAHEHSSKIQVKTARWWVCMSPEKGLEMSSTNQDYFYTEGKGILRRLLIITTSFLKHIIFMQKIIESVHVLMALQDFYDSETRGKL